MKYRVSGQNRETGARQTLELQADSRAAAERKATGTGMDVHRIEEMREESLPEAAPAKSGLGKWILLLIVLTLAAGVFTLWPTLRNLLDRAN